MGYGNTVSIKENSCKGGCTMKNETWKEIEGSNGYMISDKARVKSSDKIVVFKDGRKRFFKGTMITINMNPNGYQQVTLKVNRKSTTKYIHRLVAEYFVPNPQGLPCVNHIDGDKTNNLPSNLEWCTYQDNSLHSYETLKQTRPKACGYAFQTRATNTLTGEERVFTSVRHCERELCISRSHIFRLIKSQKQTKDGWTFSLIDVEDIERIDKDIS